jgi:hypothetical protein
MGSYWQLEQFLGGKENNFAVFSNRGSSFFEPREQFFRTAGAVFSNRGSSFFEPQVLVFSL